MYAYRVIGDLLIPAEEIRYGQLRKEKIASSVTFSTGSLAAEMLFSPTVQIREEKGQTPFADIGMGLPLTILINHIYTGRFPHKILGAQADLLLTSSLKNITAYDAASRAVNFLHPNIKRNTHFDRPPATEKGTPLVTYFPAVTSPSMTLTLDLVFHRFPDELLKKVASTFSTAAGIPLFIPASAYLLAASQLINIVAITGHGLFDGKADFSPTVSLDFAVPGSDVPQAGFWFLVERGFDTTPFKFVQGTGLVDKSTGNIYDGDVPYIVISLDGTKQEMYSKFAATVVDSAIAARYLNVQDATSVALDALQSIGGVISDYEYRKQADVKKKEIERAGGPATEDGKKLQKQYDAIVANIKDEALLPSPLPKGI